MPSDFLRLLQCFECKTVELLPDFEGPPEYDVVLHELDLKHGGHEEDVVRRHNRALHRIEKRYWENTRLRRQIHQQMWAGTTGFVPEYYATKDTLHEDALKCFSKHNRPDACSDWHSDSKRLGNPARAERAQVAREFHNDQLKEGGPRVFLCDFCPVASKVMQRRREAAGQYS